MRESKMQRIRKNAALIVGIVIAFATVGCRTTAQSSFFGDWPTGTAPDEVGKRVAGKFVEWPLDYTTNPRRDFVIYPEVCAWYGSLSVATLTHDHSLQEDLIRKFKPLVTTDTNHVSTAAHVDYRVFGVVPLEIYMQTRDPKFLELGKSFADRQWATPTDDGITGEARYWIDDMYMITAVEVQAYRATGDSKYIDRAALTMSAYLDKLQQPNGLFFHAPDSPFYWSRGNGWVAAGMTELLRSLPQNHPQRDRILDGYRKMMESLLKYQGDDGLWRQLIDHTEAWPETSGTGMFVFAMVTGVKNGWLDANIYGPAARKAWLGLVQYLDKDANLGNVCIGTNKAHQEVGPDPATQLKFYLERGRKSGDLHGQAALLWSAAALLR
jgi:rhamnogalacturonyl hydrolase YesR